MVAFLSISVCNACIWPLEVQRSEIKYIYSIFIPLFIWNLNSVPQSHLCSFSADNWGKKTWLFIALLLSTHPIPILEGFLNSLHRQNSHLSCLPVQRPKNRSENRTVHFNKHVSYWLAETLCFCSFLEQSPDRAKTQGKIKSQSLLVCLLTTIWE